ncbi:MAG: bifunctional folylpolyglutamate synthase/dihydrofolate synthase, partial [Cyclobacteriaceae bacterium]
MDYQKSLEYLYKRLPMYQRIGKAAVKPNLDNTEQLLSYLENPQNAFKSVHVAGTNGKGSSAHALAAILQKAGFKTGLYTSPHLKSFTERIRINGIPISEDEVVSFTTKMMGQVEVIRPSFFEMTVAMAFDYFRNQKVDIAVIEVGLGGRLDSTNVITPEVSLITCIGYDHMDLLGDTLPKIASEKAGIIKNKTPVVIGTYQKETIDTLCEAAKQLDAPVTIAKEVKVTEIGVSTATIKYDSRTYSVDIPATYYCMNIPGVLETVKVMRDKGFVITHEHIVDGLRGMSRITGLKGRFQTLDEEPLIIADVSHNKDGISTLINQVNQHELRELHVIFGTVRDKNMEEILSVLPKNAHYYWTEAKVPRALPGAELGMAAEG